MRKIKTFNELYEIENKKYHTTCVLDLFYIRKGYRLFDGYLILATADLIREAKTGTFYIRMDDFKKWTPGEQQYFKHYFLGEPLSN